jgi:hypothetical protein
MGNTSEETGLTLRPAPTGFDAHLQEIGRLSGRLRWQASSHCGPGTPARDWSAVRPPSPAGQLPQGSVYTCKRLVGCQAAIADRPAPTGFDAHQQEIGRLAGRHRRQASSHRVRCTPAGDWSAVRRSSRSRPEAMPPDECRSEGTPSLSEGPDAGASLFFAYFF